MKPVHFIAPVIALIIAWCLVGAQRQKITRLGNMTDVMKKHIAADMTHIGTATRLYRPTKPEIAKDAIDWRKIAESLRAVNDVGGRGDLRKRNTLSSKLNNMNKEQLLAALDEIQTLELGEEERMRLEAMLIGPLAIKDPELVLNRFFDRIGDENIEVGFALAKALGEWTKKDPVAAIAWFDKAIAEGAFDSKSLGEVNTYQIRQDFESNLISKLISIDPAIAREKISALPADQRAQALNIFDLNSKDQVTHANLVRENLSAEETYRILGSQASDIAAMGGLGKVDAYLERIGANEKERIVATEEAAMRYLYSQTQKTEVTEVQIDSMSKWLGTQAPGSVDRFTGAALGKITEDGSMNYSQAADMVMKYHAQGGGDDLLIYFLHNDSTRNHKEEARGIAEKISDPAKREQLLNILK